MSEDTEWEDGIKRRGNPGQVNDDRNHGWGDSENPDYVESLRVGYHNSVKLDLDSLSVMTAGEIMNDDIAWGLYTSEGHSIDDGIMYSDSDGEEGGEADGDSDGEGDSGED
jgi:hypothetical protein